MNSNIFSSFKNELEKLSYSVLPQFRHFSKAGFVNRKLTGVLGGNLKIPKATKQFRGPKSQSTRFSFGNLSKSSPDMKMSISSYK